MTLKYMPQLDSLRTFAVLLVMIGHYFPEDMWINFTPNGKLGVTLFFVLSGFLITQILIRSKISISNGKTTLLRSFKDFYIRRTLRIFPIYYLLLLVLFLIGFKNISSYLGWYLIYASNFLFYFLNSFKGQLAHTWTLAVEEQFYLIWPFIILLFSKRKLLALIIFFFIFGIVFRIYFLKFTNNTSFYILTPASFDSFACGAFLAYSRIYDVKININKNLLKGLVFVNIIILILIFLNRKNFYSWVFLPTIVSTLSLIIIAKASIGFDGFVKKILENKFLVYLGKISYGLYLYHIFVPDLYIWLVKFGWNVPLLGVKLFPFYKNIYIQSFIYILITIIISSVSWFLIEKPINNLKNRFKR